MFPLYTVASYEELKYWVKKGNEFSYINETNTPFREEKDE